MANHGTFLKYGANDFIRSNYLVFNHSKSHANELSVAHFNFFASTERGDNNIVSFNPNYFASLNREYGVNNVLVDVGSKLFTDFKREIFCSPLPKLDFVSKLMFMIRAYHVITS